MGQTIFGIGRRGKYLLFALSSGETLVIHLKMTGALLLRSAGSPQDRFVRVVLYLDDGQELRFSDLRKFGAIWLVRDKTQIVGQLGPEPFDPILTPQEVEARLRKRARAIKAILLDQSFIAGIGNIYADEALYEACINPLRPGNALSRAEVGRLLKAVRTVLERALANRGTSLRDYRDASGQLGANQEELLVFRRTGQGCDRCGTPVERLTISGRSSHYCPACQK